MYNQHNIDALMPAGVVGNLLSQLAPVAGGAIGNAFGEGQLGGAVGNVAGTLASMIPFAAGSGGQVAPQGVVGNLLSQLAPVAGGAIGNAFGQGQLGGAVGNVAGHLASMIPFAAGPGGQVAPQGIDVGSILSTVADIAKSAAPLLPLLLLSAGPPAASPVRARPELYRGGGQVHRSCLASQPVHPRGEPRQSRDSIS